MTIIYSDVADDPTIQNQVFDIYSIIQSLQSLFSTRPFERLFRPQYHLDLEPYLFDLITDTTAQSIFSVVIAGLQNNEPRVNVRTDLSDVIPHPDSHLYEIRLYFNIIGLDSDVFEYVGIIRRPEGV